MIPSIDTTWKTNANSILGLMSAKSSGVGEGKDIKRLRLGMQNDFTDLVRDETGEHVV